MLQSQASPDGRLAAKAATQLGLITRVQAYECGLDAAAIRRRLRAGRLSEVLPDVFLVGGAQRSWDHEVLAHILRVGIGDACASHRCAARLLRLGGFAAAPAEIVTMRKPKPFPGLVIHRVGEILPVDRWNVGPIPVTHPARTAFDLASLLEWDEAEAALEEMLMRDLFALARLRWQLQTIGGPGVRGSAHVRRFLVERPRGYVALKSPLELKVRRALQAATLPEPLYEYPVKLSTGWTVHPDFCWPHKMSAVEAQSYRWHGGRVVWERDVERFEALRRDGWTVIQVTAKMLREQRSTFINDVRKALA